MKKRMAWWKDKGMEDAQREMETEGEMQMKPEGGGGEERS